MKSQTSHPWKKKRPIFVLADQQLENKRALKVVGKRHIFCISVFVQKLLTFSFFFFFLSLNHFYWSLMF